MKMIINGKILSYDNLQRRKYQFLDLIFFFRKLLFKRIGKRTFIHPLASVKDYSKVELGDYNIINRNVTIWAELTTGNYVHINPNTTIYGKVRIGSNVMIGPNVMIASGNHGMEREKGFMINQDCTLKKPIIIEDDVWVGANVVITDGVRIRKGSVIGAGSVVTKDTQEYSINVGNPAKILKKR